MTLWVVRHACAGHKDDWDGPDDDRPLDDVGLQQAEALADVLGGTPTALWSSPTTRCVDTLLPISRASGLPVQADPALRGPGGDALVARIDDPATDGALLCTHGEVMQHALDALRSRGALTCELSDEELLLKGAAWRLDPQPDGSLTLELRAPVPHLE